MKRVRSWIAGAILFLPAFLLAIGGAIYLQDGRYENAAFPIPSDLSLNVLLPRAAYADAADVLRYTNIEDGASRLALAEARLNSGAKPQNVLADTEVSLTHAPASAEGWAFYAEVLGRLAPAKAAKALDQAFTLAPYDFFWAARRVRLAAQLWNYLDSDTKNAALRQAQMLWEEPTLHDQLLLLVTSDGGKFLTRAYADDANSIRAINRFISTRHRQLQPGKP